MRPPSVPQADVVILTALNLEYKAVRALLDFPAGNPQPIVYEGTQFEIGRLPGRRQRIALAMTGPGNTSAAVITTRASIGLRPAALIFVGVAGSLVDEVRLGDVVVATHVYDLDSRRETPEGTEFRSKGGPPDHLMLQTARLAPTTDTWSGQDRESRPNVHFKPIVAGEAVVSAKSAKAEARRRFPDAVAIEMESGGFFKAAELSEPYRYLTIRGISDMADGNKAAADASGSQPRAAANAAAFAMEVIVNAGPILSRVRPRPRRWLTVGARLALGAAALVTLMFMVAYFLFHLGIAVFYGAMEGVDTSGVQYGIGDFLDYAMGWIIWALPVLTVLCGCWLVGAALVPAPGPGRMLMPATALAFVFWITGTFVAIVLVNSLGATLVCLALACVAFGFTSRRVDPRREKHRQIGTWIGLGVIGVLLALPAGTGRLFPHPWPAIILFTAAAVAAGSLVAWLWHERRRGGPPANNVSLAELLSALAADLAIRGEDLRDIPPVRAKVVIVVLLLIPTVLVGVGIVWLPSYMEGQRAAGRAALERGYIAAGHDSALPLVFHPVTISPRRSGFDPMGICGRTPARAASLIASDGATRWILLRPIADDDPDPVAVVALSITDYQVLSVPGRDLPNDGQPWTGPACQRRR